MITKRTIIISLAVNFLVQWGLYIPRTLVSETASAKIARHTILDAPEAGYFNGTVDDVMIFNRSLDANEIQMIYESQKPVIEEPWIGLHFLQSLGNKYTGTHEERFAKYIVDFNETVKTLTDIGINVIVFDIRRNDFHFTCDEGLENLDYKPAEGLTKEECKQMAQICRDNEIGIVVDMKYSLSKQDRGPIAEVYPEFMIPEDEWEDGKYYKTEDVIEYKGVVYECIESHTSNSSVKPPNSDYWKLYYYTGLRRTRDPFNKQAEELTFDMIDELIEAFTVNGVKPDGFHISNDELTKWLNCPQECQGMTSAEVFNMSITNLYNHIKENNPEMKVMMWGDMLLGGYYPKFRHGTGEAIDMIPKDIIICDWQYASLSMPLDEESGFELWDHGIWEYPTIQYFVDKGFKVWPAGWNNSANTRALIKAGLKARPKEKMLGHLYTTWTGQLIPDLRLALLQEGDQNQLHFRVREIAKVINETIWMFSKAPVPSAFLKTERVNMKYSHNNRYKK